MASNGVKKQPRARGRSNIDDVASLEGGLGRYLETTSFPEEAWWKICSSLCLREVARAALALLSSSAIRDAAGDAWDAHVLLGSPWRMGCAGLRCFMDAARATDLSRLVFSIAPHPVCSNLTVEHSLGSPCVAVTECNHIQPRSMTFAAEPSAIAFSNLDSNGEGLLAVGIGREVKLIRRHDLKSCGRLALQGRKEAAHMVFSADGSILAVAPFIDSEAVASKIQFHTTGEPTQPMVVTIRSKGLVGFDFLHACTSKQGCIGDLVVACGMELCQVSPNTGDIVASWDSNSQRKPFSGCKAVSAYEMITMSDRFVEIWDVRTVKGLALSTETSETMTAMDARTFWNSSVIFLGDALGALHRLDWRNADAPGCELLWSPPKAEGRSSPTHMIMQERDCICSFADHYLTMLAISPCVTELGWSDISGKMRSVACGPGAWAFGAQASQGKSQAAVYLVESSGEAHLHHRRATEALDVGDINKKRKPKRQAKTQKRLPCRLANR